jgi:hypothetical protein
MTTPERPKCRCGSDSHPFYDGRCEDCFSEDQDKLTGLLRGIISEVEATAGVAPEIAAMAYPDTIAEPVTPKNLDDREFLFSLKQRIKKIKRSKRR